MKITKTPALPLSLLTLVTALLGACSSTPVATPAAAPPPVVAAAPTPRPLPPAPAAAVNPAPASTVATVSLPPYLDPNSELSTGRSVYFDFDKAVVKPEYVGVIERHGKYLGSHPALAVKIEGHTDERGSAEYNLALGQKRAESVRQSLKIYGVGDRQMEAISWGSEKPKAAGHDESAWAQNRRADIVYPPR